MVQNPLLPFALPTPQRTTPELATPKSPREAYTKQLYDAYFPGHPYPKHWGIENGEVPEPPQPMSVPIPDAPYDLNEIAAFVAQHETVTREQIKETFGLDNKKASAAMVELVKLGIITDFEIGKPRTVIIRDKDKGIGVLPAPEQPAQPASVEVIDVGKL